MINSREGVKEEEEEEKCGRGRGSGRKECCTSLTGDFSTRSREDKETFPFTRKIAQNVP